MVGVLRQEKKYLITIDEYYKLNAYLKQLMAEDSHNGVNGYMVRSLYFDSFYDSDYFDKINGTDNRKKIRLRVYDPNQNYASLEIKQKQSFQQLKRSIKIQREDAIELTKGNYEPLLEYNEELAKECYGIMTTMCYRPKTIVQYNRRAFIAKECDIRITFDSKIEANESNYDIFSDSLCLYPVQHSFNLVLEVKFNGFLLTYIRNMINSIDRKEIAVSKYCLARNISYQY